MDLSLFSLTKFFSFLNEKTKDNYKPLSDFLTERVNRYLIEEIFKRVYPGENFNREKAFSIPGIFEAVFSLRKLLMLRLCIIHYYKCFCQKKINRRNFVITPANFFNVFDYYSQNNIYATHTGLRQTYEKLKIQYE